LDKTKVMLLKQKSYTQAGNTLKKAAMLTKKGMRHLRLIVCYDYEIQEPFKSIISGSVFAE